MERVLAHDIVTAPGAQPTRTAFVLHGILGSGRNWATFARRMVRAAPQWQLVLVDLRCHGASNGFAPPHSVAACAADLGELAAHLGQEPEVVVAHSFGGKVALTFARDVAASLRRVWLLDAPAGSATPGGGADEVERVIAALAGIEQPVASRGAVQEAVQAAGLSLSLARWMTTNLRRVDEGLVWSFDLDGVRSLLQSYREIDLWDVLEQPSGIQIDVVAGARSERFTHADVERVRASLATLHILEDAGHWVHADNPDGLHQLLLSTFVSD